jgi:hypothetical protein
VWEGKDQIVRSQGRPSTETVGFGSSAVRGPPGTATIAAAGGSVNRKGSDRGCAWAVNKDGISGIRAGVQASWCWGTLLAELRGLRLREPTP